METVNNLSTAASRAIWGENTNQNGTAGQEPISGETGDVEKGEPYDAGNMENTNSNGVGKEDNLTRGDKNEVEGLNAASRGNTEATGNTPSTSAQDPHISTSKTGVSSNTTKDPSAAASTTAPSSSNDNSGAGPAPSVNSAPSSSDPPSDAQRIDKSTTEPEGHENNAIAETKREAEEAQAVDTSGPGPQSLEQKAHDGGLSGAGNGGDGGEDDGPQKESHGEGTGEKYVKSSGMKADGGDFDAANPGAGKEADRLLETKGIHHEVGAPKDDAPTEGDTGGEKSKLSIKDKIKAKLHKN
ncbi:hypothetical protein B7494_g5595 [Chlorociboria aeruginascens]|nr:hypothetical protein B7494_g5595 [Chlorociboria aeruginascens]